MRILVTRPLPGGETTARRLRAEGHDVVLAPLLVTEATVWTAPATPPSAVMMTSAAAVRLAGAGAELLKSLPAFTVGRATAAAARAAGYTDVRDGGGTVKALVDGVAAAGIAKILHLAGADRTPVMVPPDLRITTAIVYRARLLPLGDAAGFDWVLLYSARTAAHFAAECDRLGQPRAGIAIAAISANVLAAAGPGWRCAIAAAAPQEDALLAAIGAACQ
jgi:uroporphyrinogen-III synthase